MDHPNNPNDYTQLILAVGVVIANLVALVGAIASVFNGFRGRRLEASQQGIRETQQGIKENVQTIEKATNSMKDALVAATAKASLAEGTAAGLAQGRSEISTPEPIRVDIVKVPSSIPLLKD